MRHALAIAALMFLAGCNADAPTTSNTKSATTTTTTAPADSTVPGLAGKWSGMTIVVVQWAKQKELPVQLDIAPDGTVSGTVGDATLVEAQLRSGRNSIERSLGFGRDWRIHGKLQGDLIKAEQIHREAVDIVFDRSDAATLMGGLTSSGSEFGGKESMKLSAGQMLLHRQAQQ